MAGQKTIPLLIFLVVMLRGGFAIATAPNLRADPDAYALIARGIAAGGGVSTVDQLGQTHPTAFRPPAYPWLLSWLVVDGELWLPGVALLHLVLGVLTAVLTYAVADRIGGPRCGWVAAGLVTIEPLLLWSASLVMTEMLAATLTIAAWWVSQPRRDRTDGQGGSHVEFWARSAALGLVLAAGYLARPAMLVWAVSWLLVRSLRPASSDERTQSLLATGLVAVAVSLWTTRNLSVVGHPVWATTHGGYTLLLGNNELIYRETQRRWSKPWRPGRWVPWHREPWDATEFLARYDPSGHSDMTDPRHWIASRSPTVTDDRLGTSSEISRAPGESEWFQDQRAAAAAKATIRRHPPLFLISCIDRVLKLWHPFAMSTAGRSTLLIIATGAFEAVFLALSLLGGWRLVVAGRARWLMPALSLVISLTAVHAIYWSNPRMRAPAVPALAVLAAISFGTVAEDRCRSNSGSNVY